MRSRATLKWLGLALIGLLVAAGVAIAAGNLVSRQIGLASEPISAGDTLAPAAGQNRGHGSPNPEHSHGDQTTPAAPGATPEPTPTPEPETTTAPGGAPTTPTSPSNGSEDDHSGGSHGADD
jgi:hypothetical protein